MKKMNKYKCRICGEDYTAKDNVWEGRVTSPEWDAKDGRCWGCYATVILYEIFGGYLEPCIHLNGIEWMADGPMTPESLPNGPEEDIPF